MSDEERNFKGLFFQDESMLNTFHAYPEIIFIDATYKLLELGLPTYLMLCEDSNGQSEIIAVCLLVSEDAESMKWMMETLKKAGSQWRNIRIIMADKDIGERQVLKESFPQAEVLICLFHALRSFRREITCEKFGITSGQRTLCLEMIQKLAYANSTVEYDSIYARLQRDIPRQVVKYMDENWNPIKSEWVMGLKSSCGNFLNFTNNRLESINGKLKQVINRNSSLEEFIRHFFIILNTLRTERDHKAALASQKIRVHTFPEGSAEIEYSKFLTCYASGYLLKQMKLVCQVKEIKEDSGLFVIEASEGKITVDLFSCSCIFYSSMRLPCRHIFALRAKLNQPLFDPSLCDKRWTADYYKSTQRLYSHSSSSPSLSTSIHIQPAVSKLSQHQKFRKAAVVTSQLATVVSEACGARFTQRMGLLKELMDFWKNGDEVALVEIDRDGMF